MAILISGLVVLDQGPAAAAHGAPQGQAAAETQAGLTRSRAVLPARAGSKTDREVADTARCKPAGAVAAGESRRVPR
jgi:hypothetical protein